MSQIGNTVQVFNQSGAEINVPTPGQQAVPTGQTTSVQPATPPKSPLQHNDIPNAEEVVVAVAADQARNYTEAMRILRKIDADGDAAVANLAPGDTYSDSAGYYHVGNSVVIEEQRHNLAWARQQIGE